MEIVLATWTNVKMQKFETFFNGQVELDKNVCCIYKIVEKKKNQKHFTLMFLSMFPWHILQKDSAADFWSHF